MVEALRLEQIKLGDSGLQEFVNIHKSLYFDSNMRYPLDMELLGLRLLGITGLLQAAHPYHEHAEVMHWVAYNGNQTVGRIAAAVNHRTLAKGAEFKGAGFFGFYECIDSQEASDALTGAAEAWLRAKGCKTIMGPGGYSNMTHEPYQGILVEGFDSAPSVELLWNPPYYQRLIENAGYKVAMQYVTHEGGLEAVLAAKHDKRLERIISRAKRAIDEKGIELRHIDKRALAEECQIIAEIYNEAWKQNWGFVPMLQAEVEKMAENLKPIVVEELIQFAMHRGRPIGVIGGIPDPYSVNGPVSGPFAPLLNSEWGRIARTVLAGHGIFRKPTHLRAMFMGVREDERKGVLAAALFNDLLDISISSGIKSFDASLLLGHNRDVRALCDWWGLLHKKSYNIYSKPL
jgi:hypothetical protein